MGSGKRAKVFQALSAYLPFREKVYILDFERSRSAAVRRQTELLRLSCRPFFPRYSTQLSSAGATAELTPFI